MKTSDSKTANVPSVQRAIERLGKQQQVNGQSNLILAADPEKHGEFEQIYLNLRQAEGRIYSDAQLRNLPEVAPGHPLAAEWRIRAASAGRLIRHLKKAAQPGVLLEIGCGNGWLANLLARQTGHSTAALDINLAELRQGARVFRETPNLCFFYGEADKIAFSANCFRAVVMASAIQYFADIRRFLRQILNLLKPGGEIHILDSPFYAANEIKAARKRSRQHYERLGFPQMAAYYHHHATDALAEFEAKFLYEPSSGRNRFLKKFTGKEWSPFPWIVITKPELF